MERVYLHRDEAVDDVRRWEREGGYFGQAPAQPTAPAPWYAAPLSLALQLYQQRQLAKIQAERARAGLAPLSVDEFRRYYLPPAAVVEAGLAPQTRNMLTFALLGLGALLILPQLMRKR